VVSSLPLFVEQNINAEAPLKSKGRLEVKNIKDTSIVIPQLTVFWDKHITLRITAMLLRSALKLEDDDST
jgi:CTP-dependent riboflavin kinase